MFDTKKITSKISDDFFDFDNIHNDGYIPKYKDIQTELVDPSGSYNSEYLRKARQYDSSHNYVQINQGAVVNGVVTMLTTKEAIIDIGNKDNVIIDRKGDDERICKKLEIGASIDVIITKVSEYPFMLKGSLSELVKINVEQKIKTCYTDNIAIVAYVKELIPAGYLVDIEMDGITIDAFMPNTLADVNKLYDSGILIGQRIDVMLETLQQDKGIYVVSRKKYLKTLIPDKIKMIKKQPTDTVYTGHVTGTREFGIFIQFEECLTGMIHKANIREEFRDKLTSIEPGTLIEFYIKDIIKGGTQIILTQILQDSLWDSIRVGDNIQGKVITVKPFGALIELDYETNGLIQTTYINKNSKSLKKGDLVDVVVISIIRDDRKIYLTFSDDHGMVDKLKEKSSEIDKLRQKFNTKE